MNGDMDMSLFSFGENNIKVEQKVFPNLLSEFVYTRTYSRWRDDLQRRETWEETVDRYIGFLREERPQVPALILEEAREAILAMKVLPSMRALWSAGETAKRDNTCLYNCSFVPIDSVVSFAETLHILMQGAGVGFSVESKFVDNLPVVAPLTGKTLSYVVEDSTEGWADAVLFVVTQSYHGNAIAVDYSKLRLRGAVLKTKGGRASGPEPLQRLLDFCQKIILGASGRKLRSIECHDMVCFIGDITHVGGVRRAALISLSDPEDQEMRHAKDWSRGEFPTIRYMSNNSAFWDSKPSEEVFQREWQSLIASRSGERGFYRMSPAKRVTRKGDFRPNPCISGDSWIWTTNGLVKVRDLVGKTFDAVVDGEVYPSSEGGFWSNGVKPLFRLETEEGYFIDLTSNHEMCKVVGHGDFQWVAAGSLQPGDKLRLVRSNVKAAFLVATVQGLTAWGEAEVYDCSIPGLNAFDANGFYVHNCGEVSLRFSPSTDPWIGEEGSGSFCNLSAAVMRSDDTKETMAEKVRIATWIGAIQASFTYFPYLRKGWTDICEEDRLLGVDVTGQCDNPALSDNMEVMSYLNQVAIKTAKEATQVMGINMPAAITLGKPSGNSSQMVDCSSGFHPRYAAYYLRRVRIDGKDPLASLLRDSGVPMFKENGMEHLPDADVPVWVVQFPVKAPEGAMLRNSETAIQMCERYLRIMRSWCLELGHNQSATIYVREHEWEEVGEWVYEHFDEITGLSFLPYDSGCYKLAPYEEITKEQYDAALAVMPDVDFSLLTAYEQEDRGQGARELACTSGACEL